MTDDQVRDDALRLLRAARDFHVEQRGGDEESFRARTTLDLVEAGKRTDIPTGYDRHDMAVEWLESEGAIEPVPTYQPLKGITIYRVTARGLEMLRER